MLVRPENRKHNHNAEDCEQPQTYANTNQKTFHAAHLQIIES